MEDPEYYAFYSEQAAQQFGYCVYLDDTDNPVNVTIVCRDPLLTNFTYKWPDKVYVGRVTKFIKTNKTHIDMNFYMKYHMGQ